MVANSNREDRRFPVTRRAELHIKDDQRGGPALLTASVTSASAHGVGLRMTDPDCAGLARGTSLNLIIVAKGEKLRLPGKVVWRSLAGYAHAASLGLADDLNGPRS